VIIASLHLLRNTASLSRKIYFCFVVVCCWYTRWSQK